MDRLERLVNLVAALIDAERPLTRQQLRDRVGGYSDDPAAFRRNFERDKDILRQMGLPLVTETLDSDGGDDQAGYRIPRDLYELPDPGLSEAELASLRIAAGAVRLEGPWGSDATVSALRKLAAAGTAADADPAGAGPAGANPTGADPEADGTRTGTGEGTVAELAGGDAVAAVFGAIAERRRIEFAYRGEARVIDPWHLSYRRGQWYLSGFDHRRQEERMYRIDRVEGPVAVVGPAGAFELPAGGRATATPPPWRLGDQPEVVVRVLVDAVQAPWAAASVGDRAVTARRADGSIEVELAVTNRDALFSWVLGFLEHAEILAPADVRAALIDRLALLSGAPR